MQSLVDHLRAMSAWVLGILAVGFFGVDGIGVLVTEGAKDVWLHFWSSMLFLLVFLATAWALYPNEDRQADKRYREKLDREKEDKKQLTPAPLRIVKAGCKHCGSSDVDLETI